MKKILFHKKKKISDFIKNNYVKNVIKLNGSINRAIISGRIFLDPLIKTTQRGKAVNLTLITNHNEKRELFHVFSLQPKVVEYAEKNLKKG
jgi:hypothetical protein